MPISSARRNVFESPGINRRKRTSMRTGYGHREPPNGTTGESPPRQAGLALAVLKLIEQDVGGMVAESGMKERLAPGAVLSFGASIHCTPYPILP